MKLDTLYNMVDVLVSTGKYTYFELLELTVEEIERRYNEL